MRVSVVEVQQNGVMMTDPLGRPARADRFSHQTKALDREVAD
jgi:hypothetical protein